METLYTSKPSVGMEELKRVQKVFDSNWLGMGDVVRKFEIEVENFLGNGIVIAVNSGTSALHLALESIGIRAGDEVIAPSLTFCASIQVITALGAKPIFCEVNSNNLSVNIEDIKSKINSRTKAIIPVHYCGIACEMDSLIEIKNEFDIHIIEDAAHAFGSKYNGKKIGSFGDICCFSFDPIKNITCGEGGAIVVHDKKLADLIRKKRVLGIDKDGWQRHTENKQGYYDVSTQGFRYHMSNINAAIGLAQLERVESFYKKKIDLVQHYNLRLTKIEYMELLDWNLSETFPFAYVVKVTKGHRDHLMKHLLKNNVQSGLNYIPNHLQSYFKTNVTLPLTEQIFDELITLPLYNDLTINEVEYVIECIESYFNSRTRRASTSFKEEVSNV
ncbi:DegT/DnrJ/EryC1/StrS family aminotransferase [Fulvivirgaceae bacterium BMA10]|uniref:DegT/DnrJ/EryC1/StrS family aminotransferase n=1 Tax=Splendidivirga corallicola TaxID=3051826 RepID=A0ABT8KLT6_9BACT|nr:DegT/DnrJ/EryC1/StrS family aminotransferase [Fulvivirgaceae bacterium BMA10]